MRVEISRAARRFVQRSGNAVYIWFEDVGGAWSSIHVETQAPVQPIVFARYDADGVGVLLQADVEPPVTIRIELSAWPFRRLEVAGFGAGYESGPPFFAGP